MIMLPNYLLVGVKLTAKIIAGCTIEEDIDYHGNDINDKVVGSSQACADFCASTTDGKYWTWNRGDKRCFVKTSKSGRTNKAMTVSGNRGCGGPGSGSHTYD